MAIKRICPRCGGFHGVGEKCPFAPKRTLRGATKKETDANIFRQTTAWKKKAIEIKERDTYLCQYCKAHGKYTFDRLSVHHITPLIEDMDKRLDNDNLITLCDSCHKQAEIGVIPRKELQDIVEKIEGQNEKH